MAHWKYFFIIKVFEISLSGDSCEDSKKSVRVHVTHNGFRKQNFNW